MMEVTANDAAAQKTLDDYAESDSTILMAADDVLVEISVVIKQFTEQQAHERHVELEREKAQWARNEQDNASMHSAHENANANTVKLPKLELKTFSGNVMHWQEFWDAFEASVHNQESLSDIAKFTYLKSQLTGAALNAITGLALT